MGSSQRRSCVFLFLFALASAAPGAPSDQLNELRSRISKLQRQLTQAEETKSEAADALRESERAISDTSRRLFGLGQEQRKANLILRELQARRVQMLESTEAQQQRLAKLLYRQYVAGQPEPLRVLLNRQDPNDIARQIHYLSYVSQTRADLIAALRRDLADLDRLASQTEEQARVLSRLQSEQTEEQRRLEQQRRGRADVLKQVSDEIARQRKQMRSLRRNEQRLAKLVDSLARELARPPAGRARLRNQQLPEPSAATGSFHDLKGRLRLPVIGALANRFGAQRADGGLSWKGLFIAARQGDQVLAVAAGRVVFADWLRGFGNLLILDHGGGYMSLYANNEALLRQVGDLVKAGDPIAAVGATGGNPETGLYFELRFQGKPFDPLTWVTLN